MPLTPNNFSVLNIFLHYPGCIPKTILINILIKSSNFLWLIELWKTPPIKMPFWFKSKWSNNRKGNGTSDINSRSYFPWSQWNQHNFTYLHYLFLDCMQKKCTMCFYWMQQPKIRSSEGHRQGRVPGVLEPPFGLWKWIYFKRKKVSEPHSVCLYCTFEASRPTGDKDIIRKQISPKQYIAHPKHMLEQTKSEVYFNFCLANPQLKFLKKIWVPKTIFCWRCKGAGQNFLFMPQTRSTDCIQWMSQVLKKSTEWTSHLWDTLVLFKLSCGNDSKS